MLACFQTRPVPSLFLPQSQYLPNYLPSTFSPSFSPRIHQARLQCPLPAPVLRVQVLHHQQLRDGPRRPECAPAGWQERLQPLPSAGGGPQWSAVHRGEQALRWQLRLQGRVWREDMRLVPNKKLHFAGFIHTWNVLEFYLKNIFWIWILITKWCMNPVLVAWVDFISVWINLFLLQL